MRAFIGYFHGLLVMSVAIALVLVNMPSETSARGPSSRVMLYGMYTKLSYVDASYVGEAAGDTAGRIRRAGDVNGDGFDDFLVMAWNNGENGVGAGQTYLILGRETGWKMDGSLANADASFLGEFPGDQCGNRGSDAGDVNGDGYDDFIIPAVGNDEGGIGAGQAYLIFGKATGWKMDTNLSDSDASFIGEYAADQAGREVGGKGDINGDGFDDLLVCSPGNKENGAGAGQVYLFLGKASGWSMDTNCSDADASFLGENAGDSAGYEADVIADVNGDGLDDILISSPGNDEGGTDAGQVYLFFGRRSGWMMDTDLSKADSSFQGENAGDRLGDTVHCEGDHNGDGYNDILIGSMANSDGGTGAGQVYIVFGKSSGWSRDTDIGNADGSYIGEFAGDNAGWVDCLGDVNMDGIDDFVVGAYTSDKGGADSGQVYVVLGKSSGWAMDVSLSKAACSFYGENPGDGAGRYAPVGDVNGDGSADLVIGAYGNDQGGADAGQAYVIFLYYPNEPLSVDSVKVYSDQLLTEEVDRVQMEQEVHIKLTGVDANPDKVDMALVNVSSTLGFPRGFRYWLIETGPRTGVYTNTLTITSLTDPDRGMIRAGVGEEVMIGWNKDPTKNATVLVSAAMLLTPVRDVTRITEDSDYLVRYHNEGFNEVLEWEFESDADWLIWDGIDHELSGSPDNGDVGFHDVRIAISDGLGNSDEHAFKLEVVNRPPCIFPMEDVEVMEDEYFEVDCDCDDEGCGGSEWSISPSYFEWLDMDPITGLISGTPSNDDVGVFQMNISIDDGNQGYAWERFNLTVIDRNDPPVIMTEPPTSVVQGKQYYVQFLAMDQDDVNTFEWTVDTDADFLSLDNQTGVLSGRPDNDDVGSYIVNVTAADLRGLEGWKSYELEVIDANDIPAWERVPPDSKIDEGEDFTFTMVASDVDAGDFISYGISSRPDSDITIDADTGSIFWTATLEGLKPTPFYVLNVGVTATDGSETIYHSFTITVEPNPSPRSTLIGPPDGKRITSKGILLEWKGEDDGEEPLLYDVYLGTFESDVSVLNKIYLWREDLKVTSVHTGELEAGKTYFWTVVPKDGFSSGSCTSGVFGFTVNKPPRFEEFTVPGAHVGTEFRLMIEGSDGNNDDLEFILISGPEGMELLNGMMSWVPSADQIGPHLINVSLSDGYEEVYLKLTVEVLEEEVVQEEDEEGTSYLWLIILAILVLVIIVIGIGVFLFMRTRNEEDSNRSGGSGDEMDSDDEAKDPGTDQGPDLSDP
ncbi:MAG: putative Ig domain-containing protein [Thermoplasmatota archaeon]